MYPCTGQPSHTPTSCTDVIAILSLKTSTKPSASHEQFSQVFFKNTPIVVFARSQTHYTVHQQEGYVETTCSCTQEMLSKQTLQTLFN